MRAFYRVAYSTAGKEGCEEAPAVPRTTEVCLHGSVKPGCTTTVTSPETPEEI